MAVEEFIESVGRRSEKTADSYQRGLDLFSLCHRVDSPDSLVARVKAGELNQYQLLDKYVSFLNREGYAPKSIWGYVSAVKSFYGYEELDLDDRKFKKTVRLPTKTEISLDRIPTPEEVRDLFIHTNAKKCLEWLDSHDLSIPEGVDVFLRGVVRATWTGQLGTRAAGALNGSLRILLEHLLLPSLEKRIRNLEDSHEPRQESRDQIIGVFVNSLPPGLKDPLVEYFKHQIKLEGENTE